VEVSAGRGKPSVVIDKDESLEKFDPVKLSKLRPSFKETGGTVTAGNASSIRHTGRYTPDFDGFQGVPIALSGYIAGMPWYVPCRVGLGTLVRIKIENLGL
ncbi:hypothetical protein B296_00023957, partial [Ensete ventricosum]